MRRAKQAGHSTSSHEAPLIPGHRAASDLFPAQRNILAAQGDLRSVSAAQSRWLLTIRTDGDTTADPVLMFTSVVSSVSFKNPPCIKPPESHGERALGNMQLCF